MKTVIVSEYVQQPNKTWKLQEKGQAELLCFGINHEQYDNSTGHFTTAVVMYSDGTVANVPVEHIRFTDNGDIIYWRDVVNELPQEAQEVLFVRGGKTVHGAWIGGIFWHNNQKCAAATWMPLPKPPVNINGEDYEH